MNLKNIAKDISGIDKKREELSRIKEEYEKLFEPYLLLRRSVEEKKKSEFAKELEITKSCSHPLSIMYDYSGICLRTCAQECVLCRHPFLKFEHKNYLTINTLLKGEEPGKVCEFIRRRLVQLSENNPNMSLEEAKKIIASELPAFEESLVKGRISIQRSRRSRRRKR